jgi:hypothetical protein
MTESQKAFEIAMSASMDRHERNACKIAWREGIAYGRKHALEDVANGFIKQKSWMQDYAHAVVQHAADEGALK